MPDGSEFQTAGAATLKPREAKVVRTRGADNRLVFAERRQRVGVTTGHCRDVDASQSLAPVLTPKTDSKNQTNKCKKKNKITTTKYLYAHTHRHNTS